MIDTTTDSQWRRSQTDPEYAGRVRTFESFWLCSSCCAAMRVQSNGDHGFTVVPKREGPNAPGMEKCAPIAA